MTLLILTTAAFYILLLAAPLNLALTYALVWSERFGIGFIGLPIATAFTMNLKVSPPSPDSEDVEIIDRPP